MELTNGLPGKLNPTGTITTTNLDFFVDDELNREKDEDALLDLQDDFNQDINDHEYPFQAPIVVFWQEGMNKAIVNQGHHRLEVCKRTNREINYVVTNFFRPSSRGQESQHQAWTTEDLVKSYALEGIESYTVLNRLKTENPEFSYMALAVFLNNTPSSKDKLRNRDFTLIPGASYEKASERIKKYNEYKRMAMREDNSKEVIRVLVNAMENPLFDWGYFLERAASNAAEVKTRPEFASISTNARATSLIQFLYNYKSKKNFYF